MRSTALNASDAISPHTLTGRLAARPTSTTRWSWRTIAGWWGVKRSARRALPRSTASVYWVRSLVPTLKKALTSARRSAIDTDAGVSIITPTGTSCAARTPACLREAASSAIISRAFRPSPPAPVFERAVLLPYHLPRLPDLVHPGHQRKHELHVPPHRGPENRPD